MKRKKLGPIHGIPFSVKDLNFTKGVRTMSGSHIFADRVPDQDAPFVRRPRGAGGVFIATPAAPGRGRPEVWPPPRPAAPATAIGSDVTRAKLFAPVALLLAGVEAPVDPEVA